MQLSTLSDGYHLLPPGKLAEVVTCLEMTIRPNLPPPRAEAPSLQRFGADDVDRFLALFRAIGHNHLWYSRLVMPKDELASVLGDPRIESYALLDGNADIGLLELDFREPETCELAFFGLVPQAIGKGAGRFLMREALSRAWAKPIKRLWVHTCHFDHPAALEFYMRSGFTPYAWIIEIHDDPRLTGHVPRDACPQVPIIGLPLVD